MIHGHKKTDKKKSQQQVKQQNQLSEKINNKLGQFFKIRNQPIAENKTQALMEFTTILMQLCPDITTIFNYRRELIQKLQSSQDAIGKAKILGGDIKLITKIMQGDPKSYTLWSYRQWLVLKLFQIDPSIITKQKELCTLLLTKDEKNFHVWNYRNWVNNIQMNVDVQLQFTRSKINSNPFNFSAYHFRSKYLTWKYEHQIQKLSLDKQEEIKTYGMPKQIFDSELQTVRTAIFLNPKQQAPWLYYNWLLSSLSPILLLQIKPLVQKIQNIHVKHLTYEILLSHNVQNFKQAVIVQGGVQFQLVSHTSPSNKWQIRLKQPVEINDIQISSTKAQISKIGACKKIINPTKQIIDSFKIIYEAQEQFIKQVLESQQNKCRFAWLQLLQVLRLQLYLGTNEQQWSQITRKGLQAFNQLEGQSKGQKYVLKQKIQWERLNNATNLTQIERTLKIRK